MKVLRGCYVNATSTITLMHGYDTVLIRSSGRVRPYYVSFRAERVHNTRSWYDNYDTVSEQVPSGTIFTYKILYISKSKFIYSLKTLTMSKTMLYASLFVM